ncbi:hypothetical protein HF1_10140 [Mycoplasma haemofelis str. Langford 1]|uniref:Uncharacterized protein n=1 Tax=Mycoplasma haemofelis (strain Langford 1) TaxID=941640 RepID=E8ZIQ1_MYCHL|nr:hypothetical protein [Mycoplasma haemofelis]CBY93022.1 hypothetical protein HF1_10140 [Mycoplasma haemofelis str. Langford 1]
MSNLTPVAILLVGTGGVAYSYYSAPERVNKSISSKVNVLFKDKYGEALLRENHDQAVWQGKWNVMKASKPTHDLLKKAIEHTNYSHEAQKLHKEGCLNIYESVVMATSYFSDFQQYCAKNNRDVLIGKWIVEDPSKKAKNKKGSDWDKKLEELQKVKKQELSVGLLDLYAQLEKVKAPKDLKDEHRVALKGWCDSSGEEIYLGSEVGAFKVVKKFCTSN